MKKNVYEDNNRRVVGENILFPIENVVFCWNFIIGSNRVLTKNILRLCALNKISKKFFEKTILV